MRSLGVRAVDVTSACKHEASVNEDALADDLAVPDIGLRLRCSKLRRKADRDPSRLDDVPSKRQAVATMPPTTRREIFLDKGTVTIECPRLMTVDELAQVLAAFVEAVMARTPAQAPVRPEQPSRLPPVKRPPRRSW
jgi:hypothetical protein